MLHESTLKTLFDHAWESYELLRQEADAAESEAMRDAESAHDDNPRAAGEAVFMTVWNSDLGRAIRHVERMTRLAYYTHPDVKERLLRRAQEDKQATQEHLRRYPPRPLKNKHVTLDDED